jgi:polyisoprenoid-binding protein YceI
MPNNTTAVPSGLATGTWLVDSRAGHVNFRVKTMWGLADVKGSFDRSEGTLEIKDRGATGELIVHTDSLDTKNAKRDEHLRSADFFDSKSHPRVTFIATGARAAPGGAMISGELTVGKHTTRLEVPVVIEPAGEDEVTVRASTVIPRKDVGLTWNKMGMIKSDARLDIELRLIAGA